MAGANSTVQSVAEELPQYLLDRLQRARRAGLEIKRLRVSGEKLSTAFEGTPSQFIEAGLLENSGRLKKWIDGTAKQFSGIYKDDCVFSPTSYLTRVTLKRIDSGKCYMSFSEQLPVEVKPIDAVITRYIFTYPDKEFGQEEVHIFAGASIEKIVQTIGAPQEIMEQGWIRTYGGGAGILGRLIWSSDNGTYPTVEHHVTQERQHLKETMPSYTNQGEYAEHLNEMMRGVRHMLEVIIERAAESRNGFSYSLSDEAQALVMQHMSAIGNLMVPANVRRKATRLQVLRGGKT